MILSMFSSGYNSVKDFYANNKTYEDIENNLVPQIRAQLVFEGLEDVKMLRYH